jgi:hypothetical protein
MLNEYYYITENVVMGYSKNCIILLHGCNGNDDTICHCSQIRKYNAYPNMTMYNLFKDQMDLNGGLYSKSRRNEPFYLVGGIIDLDKFSIVPINDGAKLEPDTHYVVTTGNDKFKVVLSNEDGTLSCTGVKAYLPILSRDIASKIFVKYHKLERKLEKMKKDFE